MYSAKDEEGRRKEGEGFLGLRKVKYLQSVCGGGSGPPCYCDLHHCIDDNKRRRPAYTSF